MPTSASLLNFVDCIAILQGSTVIGCYHIECSLRPFGIVKQS